MNTIASTTSRMLKYIPVAAVHDNLAYNPRKSRSAKEDKDFERSIEALGITTPISVWESAPDEFTIIAGHRRAAAARSLVKRGKWSDEAAIPALIFDIPPGKRAPELRVLALVENTQRAALHPVDTYEAVAAIMRDGGNEKDAARQLGMSQKAVQQAVALGAIAPEVLADWRAGKIDADVARAFTLAPSRERQIEVWQNLKKAGQLYAYAVREAFGIRYDLKASLAAVGEDVYRAAGGSVRRDLFSEEVAISDFDLLNRLADEKVTAECARLIAEGWAWAVPKRQVTNYWRYEPAVRDVAVSTDEKARLDQISARLAELEALDELDDAQDTEREALENERVDIQNAAGARAYTAEVKAASGCFVSLAARAPGGLNVEFGKVAPSGRAALPATVAVGAADDQDAGADGPKISGPLIEKVTGQLTVAAAEVIRNDHTLALRVMLAGLRSFSDAPCRMSGNGYLASFKGEAFDKALADELARDDDEVLPRAARAIANALDLRIMRVGRRRADVQALLEAIGEPRLRAAAVEAFDPDAFFASASLAVMAEAVAEMNATLASVSDGNAEPLVIPKGTKAERAAWAAERAREAGWLPLAMRLEADAVAPALDDEPDEDEGDDEDAGDE